MSSPVVHIAQGLGSAVALYPLLGENALIFGASIILMDTDHILEYVWDTKSIDPRGFFVYHDILLKNLDKGYLGFNLFHTIECYLLLLWLGQVYPTCYYILGGFLFHHLFDQVSLIKKKCPFVRVFSIPEYLVRKQTHITSIKELLQLDSVDVDGISNLKYWLDQWGVRLNPYISNNPATRNHHNTL